MKIFVFTRSALFSVCLAMIIVFNSKAQKQISIGDHLPELPPLNITNSKASLLQPHEYKDKYIIIDFWATWCIPCVAGIPKMQKLEKMFQGKLKVIFVSNENKKTIDQFLIQYRKLKRQDMYLPTVYGDTLLSNYLPHLSIPHLVWLNPDRKIVAITRSDEVNVENVEKFLNGKTFHFLEKNDGIRLDKSEPFLNEKLSKPLLVDSGFWGSEKIRFRSVLTKRAEGYRLGGGNYTGRLIGSDVPLGVLFCQAYEYSFSDKLAPVLGNRMVLEVKNPEKIILRGKVSMQERVKWNRDNSYNYDLLLPDYYKGLVLDPKYEFLRKISCEIMKRNLESFSGIKSGLEDRNTSCIVLKRIKHEKIINEANGPARMLPGKSGFVASNVEDLHFMLSYFLQSDAPVISDIPLDELINVKIESRDMSNANALSSELEKYGLTLSRESRKIPMLVLKD